MKFRQDQGIALCDNLHSRYCRYRIESWLTSAHQSHIDPSDRRQSIGTLYHRRRELAKAALGHLDLDKLGGLRSSPTAAGLKVETGATLLQSCPPAQSGVRVLVHVQPTHLLGDAAALLDILHRAMRLGWQQTNTQGTFRARTEVGPVGITVEGWLAFAQKSGTDERSPASPASPLA